MKVRIEAVISTAGNDEEYVGRHLGETLLKRPLKRMVIVFEEEVDSDELEHMMTLSQISKRICKNFQSGPTAIQIYSFQVLNNIASAEKQTKKTKPARKADGIPKPVQPGEILRLADFLERTQMKDAAWAQVKRQCAERGIQIASLAGRNVYVSTDAWLEFLKSSPARKTKVKQRIRKPKGEVE